MQRLFNYLRYDIPAGIRNVVYWAPVVWGLRRWDYTYLVRIMIHALKDMEDLHKKHGHFVDTHKTIKQLAIARAALERHDNYDDLIWLEYIESPDPKNFFGGRFKLKPECPFGSKKALYAHEAIYKRRMRIIFAKQFVSYLERWWD